MPYLPYDLTNTAATTVGTDLSATATSLTLASGGGAVVGAAGPLPLYIRLGASSPLSEVAQVTAIASDTLTLVRGVNRNTSIWLAGTTVQAVKLANEEQTFQAVTAALSIANRGLTSASALNGGAGGTPVLLGNTAVATGAAGTIATAGIAVSKVNPAADRTGCILAAGTVDGQTVTVVNKSAHSVTFDVAGTSNVADGSSDVIATLTAATYVWESVSALWYRTV